MKKIFQWASGDKHGTTHAFYWFLIFNPCFLYGLNSSAVYIAWENFTRAISCDARFIACNNISLLPSVTQIILTVELSSQMVRSNITPYLELCFRNHSCWISVVLRNASALIFPCLTLKRLIPEQYGTLSRSYAWSVICHLPEMIEDHMALRNM